MMPQKLNPDVAELARGKAGTAIGRLTGLLAVVKGLPLAYDRDLQEDKAPVFAARRDVAGALGALAVLVGGLELDHERLAAAASDPAALATDAAEALVASGVPFRDAHEQIAAQVRAGSFEAPEAGRRAAPGPGDAVAAVVAARARWGSVNLPAALSIDLGGRSLLRLRDWMPAEVEAVLDFAAELKLLQTLREPHRLLEGRTLGLLFRQHSTRTRVSLEVAAAHLGATAVYLASDQMQLARGETIEDTGRVLARYLDAIAIRTYDHDELERLDAGATVPVLNALTERAHPLQALADLLTIRERFGALEGVRVAWVGDGNNVCASLAEGCALTGADFVCASPDGYEPEGLAAVRDPREAVAGAQVVVTDVWTSMGEDGERDERLAAFAGYSVDEALLAVADPDAIVLHCLPAHPGEEITADVLYGPRSAVWDEAENRLHTAKAVLALVVK